MCVCVACRCTFFSNDIPCEIFLVIKKRVNILSFEKWCWHDEFTADSVSNSKFVKINNGIKKKWLVETNKKY